MKRNPSGLYVHAVCFIISIGGLLLGISANVSGASRYFGDFFGLTAGSLAEGLAVGMTMLATFIGNFFAGNISNRIGRKKALMLAAALFSFCTLGSALSQTYVFFLISRFIGGLGIGISLLVAPLYLAEIAPASRRGFFVSFNQLNIGIGYLLAYASNTLVNGLVTDPELKWRFMLGAGFVFPVLYLAGLAFVPESPLWLAARGKRAEAAHAAAKTGADIPEERSAPQEIPSRKQWRLLFNRKMRLVLAVAFSIAFFQMASGINAVLFYAPKVFRMAGFGGDSSFLQSNLVGICMVVMTLVSMAAIDRIGRRPLLIVGVSIMIAAFATISGSFYAARYVPDTAKSAALTEQIARQSPQEAKKVEAALQQISQAGPAKEKVLFRRFKAAIDDETLYSKYKSSVSDISANINSGLVLIAILMAVIGFSISLGPVTWAFLSEVFPFRVKGLGISLAGMFNGMTSFAVTTLFPFETEHLGSGNTFLLYAIIMIACLLCVLTFYPETKGRKLEEVERELIKE